MSSEWAVVAGTAIGGVIGLVGNRMTITAANRRAEKTWVRKHKQLRYDQVMDCYRDVLVMVLNFATAVNVPGAQLKTELAREVVFARLNLIANQEVKETFDKCFNAVKTTGDPALVPELIKSMKRHLHQLDTELLRGQ